MKRFGYVLKLDFAEKRKSFILGSLTMLLLYLFFFSIGWRSFFMHYEVNDMVLAHVESECSMASRMGIIAMYVFFLVAASGLYRNEQKKQQRSAWLMLPATNLEKYLARWVYLLAYSVVGGVLAFVVADLLNMCWLAIGGYPVVSATDNFFSMWPIPDSDTFESPHLATLTIAKLVVLTMFYVFYHMGGMLFKRFHFLMSTLLALAFLFCVSLFDSWFIDSGILPIGVHNRGYFYIFLALCATVLFAWNAYRIFCRWQIIHFKMTKR